LTSLLIENQTARWRLSICCYPPGSYEVSPKCHDIMKIREHHQNQRAWFSRSTKPRYHSTSFSLVGMMRKVCPVNINNSRITSGTLALQ